MVRTCGEVGNVLGLAFVGVDVVLADPVVALVGDDGRLCVVLVVVGAHVVRVVRFVVRVRVGRLVAPLAQRIVLAASFYIL